MSDDQLELFGEPESHARRGDPDTSHEAGEAVSVSAQCLRVLRSYRDGKPLLDHDAYRIAGMNSKMGQIQQRCSDLRHAGYIQRTGRRAKTPAGREGYLCCITTLGLRYLQSKEGGLPLQMKPLRYHQTGHGWKLDDPQ